MKYSEVEGNKCMRASDWWEGGIYGQGFEGVEHVMLVYHV
jgi:hypothetical protein